VGGRERELFSRGVRALLRLSRSLFPSFSFLVDSSRARSEILVKVFLPPLLALASIFLSHFVEYISRKSEKRAVDREGRRKRARENEGRRVQGPFRSRSVPSVEGKIKEGNHEEGRGHAFGYRFVRVFARLRIETRSYDAIDERI